MKNKKELGMGDYVTLKKLRKIIEKFDGCDEMTPVNFEFIMASCFPDIYQNMLKKINETYAEGFFAGKEDASKRN